MEKLTLAGPLLLWNLYVFYLYGLDKFRSKNDKLKRVSEKALLGAAFALGGIGAAAGMAVFRHKTQHTNFKMLVPIALILNLILFTVYLFS